MTCVRRSELDDGSLLSAVVVFGICHLPSAIPGGPQRQFVNIVALLLPSLCGEMRCRLEFQAGS